MSDQGERSEPRVGEGRDWWSQLYHPGAPDTGGSPADDTIDDRFASARAVGASGSVEASGPPPAAPRQEPGPAGPETPDVVASAPDDPLPVASEGPADALTTDPERPAWLDRLFGTDPAEDELWEPEEDPGSRGGPSAAAPGPAAGVDEPGEEPPPEPPAPGGPGRRSVRGVFGHGSRRGGGSTTAVPPRPGHTPPEPGELTAATPGALSDLAPDTVLDGARHGSLVLRAVSLRGGSARRRGEPRGDALFTARFGTGAAALLFAAVAVGTGAAPAGRRAAREVCQSIGEAVGRSRSRLVDDIMHGRRAPLVGGLRRLTDRCYGRLRAQAAALELSPREYHANLRCLLVPTDPACATAVVFGAGGGGLFRLREGSWTDLEPHVDEVEDTRHGTPPSRLPDPRGPEAAAGEPEPGPPLFRFRAVATEPGDALMLCSTGLAVPLRGDPGFADQLATRWSERSEPPDLVTFLTDLHYAAPAYGDDRTAVTLWRDPR